MDKRRVVITALGVISPVGNTVKEFWTSLLAGKSGTGPLKAIPSNSFSSRVSAEVRNFDPLLYLPPKQVKKTDRFVQFALAAAQMTFQDSGLDLSREDPYRIGVLVGSGIGGLHTIEEQYQVMLEKGPERISPFLIPMLIINMAPGQISINYGLKGPNSSVATACATGNHALGDAFRIIQKNEAEVMIAGGTEACITILGFGGFDAMRALSTYNDEPQRASRPFDQTRNGFVMGEGCGLLILEELVHARRRRAKIYAEIVGYGMSADAAHITQPDPSGEGAARCMELALKDAGLSPDEVDYINAHGTSTPLNDKIETLAIKRALGEGKARKVMISSTKSMTGHLLGAAGGIEAIASCLAIKENVIPPTINYSTPDPECDLDYVPNQARQAKVKVVLSNSLGFGGHNATLCFKKFE